MALVAEGRRRSATVAALEEAETFAVYQGDFERLRREHRGVDGVLIAFLAGELRRQNQLLLEALYVPVERRVLRRLLELTEFYGEGDHAVPLTQEQLAELAGTSRSTVNRVLREEEQRGSVELRRGAEAQRRPRRFAAPVRRLAPRTQTPEAESGMSSAMTSRRPHPPAR
jgi:CRP/FNR family transcriptional regulator, cyclic AMP receptor protein